MTAITYTARLSVISGHTAGQSYTLETDMSAIDPTTEMDREPHVALDGTTETLWNRLDKHWSFSTIPLDDLAPQIREFLDSALTGEPFLLDIYGTGDFVRAILEGNRYRESRVGTGHLFRFTFEVRLL